MGATFRDADDYLQMYPRFLKWINQCAACGAKGHKPELPANDAPRFTGQNLRRYFTPLGINSDGLCEQCARHVSE
jgi:hypothetical protein